MVKFTYQKYSLTTYGFDLTLYKSSKGAITYMPQHQLERILYVEDEIDIQTLTKLSLETYGGFTVRACGSGWQALEAAPEFKPDLLLLDLMMPGLDGLETLKALREREATATTPAIIMTARPTSEIDLASYKKMGALGVISKPFIPSKLPSMVVCMWGQ